MAPLSKLSSELITELIARYTSSENPSTQDDLVRYCASLNINVDARTIRREFQKLGVEKKYVYIDTPELRARIAALYFLESLDDPEILTVLRSEGYRISCTNMKKVRRSSGIKRRLPWEETEAREAEFRDQIQAVLDTGTINTYGRTMLQTYFRCTAQMLISRDRLFRIVKELDPVGLYNRSHAMTRRRGEYITPGPDFCWSLDAYCKLEEWGIQIYAAIDAYSRNVLWTYVGVSSRTKISVFYQLATAFNILKRAPHLIRSDKGAETIMAADAQYQMARIIRGDNCTFRSAWAYGTSTLNVRIESWWGQISKGQLLQWNLYFKRLSLDGSYNKLSEGDRIAFKYIYIPIVRNVVLGFVRVWNRHLIRKQKNRPHSVSGRPHILYNYSPHLKRCGHPIDQPFVDRMLNSVALWDPDETLPSATTQWCCQVLQNLGYERGRPSPTRFVQANQKREFEIAYFQLRTAVHNHLRSGLLPQLEETPPPYIRYNWTPSQETMDVYNLLQSNPHSAEARELEIDDRDIASRADEMAEDKDFDEQLELVDILDEE